MYRKIREFINRSIERRLIALLIPAVCGTFILSYFFVSCMYSRDLIESIEVQTQYAVETSRINMDYCLDSVKSAMNNLSNNSSIREIVSMDLGDIDYKEYLEHERNLKQTVNAFVYTNRNLQDLVIVGKNGYQYESLNSFYTNIMETEWFQAYVAPEKMGFQYILPHDLNYYSDGKRPACDKAVSVLLPIKEAGHILGYVIADIGIDRMIDVPEVAEGTGNIKTYFVNQEMEYYYDAVNKENYECAGENFLSILTEKKNDFTTVGNDFIAYSKMQSSGWYIVSVYEHDDIIRSVRRIQRIGIAVVFISCFLILLIGQRTSRYINRPIQELLARIQAVGRQDFRNVESDYKNQPGEIVLIRKRFEEMVQQIDELVNKVYLDELYQKEMEYEQLVNQINPHFLYNVLQLIQSKAVLSENFEINDIVVALSRLLRYAMNNQNKIVTVQEAGDYVTNYLLLYERRYTGKISYKIAVEPGLEQCRIIKFVIQPVVENCIKHGMHKQEKGEIIVDIRRQENLIRVSVWDNGKGISKERLCELNKSICETSEKEGDGSIGLRNVYQRLKLRYGDRANMQIESEEGSYTKVILLFPMEDLEEGK